MLFPEFSAILRSSHRCSFFPFPRPAFPAFARPFHKKSLSPHPLGRKATSAVPPNFSPCPKANGKISVRQGDACLPAVMRRTHPSLLSHDAADAQAKALLPCTIADFWRKTVNFASFSLCNPAFSIVRPTRCMKVRSAAPSCSSPPHPRRIPIYSGSLELPAAATLLFTAL